MSVSTTTRTESEPRTVAPSDATGQAAPAARPRQNGLLDGRGIVVLQVLVGLLILGAWEAAAQFRLINPILFSRPTQVIQRIGSFLTGETIYSRTIYDHLLVTFQAIAIGYVIGALLGIALGFAFGRSRFLAGVFEPYILALYSIPKVALAPLFVLILGIGLESKIGIVAMEVFFMLFFNTFAGVIGINEEHLHLARIMGASRGQVVRRVIIPSALPSIMVGLKMGIPFAMIGAIIGEFIASNQGLGWLILYSTSSFDSSGLFAAIAFLVAVTWGLGQLLALLEARLLSWRPSHRQEAVNI